MTESEMFKKRIIDLSKTSYERGIYTYSDFLTLAEQADLNALISSGNLYSKNMEVFGGYQGAERVLLRFGSSEDLGYEDEWPISCLKITPLNNKFAEDLSHRDILGSLMNLGIKRGLLGDILLPRRKDTPSEGKSDKACAYVFLQSHMAQTLCQDLTRIKHTSVLCNIVSDIKEIPSPSLQDVNLQVKSERIDLIIAHTYNLSRSQAAELFPAKKVYINGRQMENESHLLSSGDLISVRGLGRFIYSGINGHTKKGNLIITISKYI